MYDSIVEIEELSFIILHVAIDMAGEWKRLSVDSTTNIVLTQADVKYLLAHALAGGRS